MAVMDQMLWTKRVSCISASNSDFFSKSPAPHRHGEAERNAVHRPGLAQGLAHDRLGKCSVFVPPPLHNPGKPSNHEDPSLTVDDSGEGSLRN